MAYPKKEKHGVLFYSREKRSEKSPDMVGEIVFDGVSYELAAWNNTSRKGTRYFSIRAQEKKGITQEDWERKKQQYRQERNQ